MAMNITTKLGVAVGILIALGVVVGVRISARDSQSRAHSVEEKSADLPAVQLGELGVQAADRVAITVPGETGPTEVVLVKKDDAWALESPVAYPADGQRVDSLLNNLAKLNVKERVDASADGYASHGLGDDEARHLVVSSAGTAIVDLYVGDGGSRGQMTRFSGRDGVYAVSGYSKQAVELDADAWRDKTVMTFDPAKVTKVQLNNENSKFAFTKAGDDWQGRMGSRSIPRFDPAKVTQLLNAFKGLKATGFGDGEILATAGLEKPNATLTFQLNDGSALELLVGGVSSGTNHWAKLASGPQIFDIGSAAVNWATADPSKFAKPKDSAKP